MSRTQQHVYHVEPSRFPPDFPERLERFREAAGLSWRGLARRLRVSARCVWALEGGNQAGPGTPGPPCSTSLPRWGCSTSCCRRSESRRQWIRGSPDSISPDEIAGGETPRWSLPLFCLLAIAAPVPFSPQLLVSVLRGGEGLRAVVPFGCMQGRISRLMRRPRGTETGYRSPDGWDDQLLLATLG